MRKLLFSSLVGVSLLGVLASCGAAEDPVYTRRITERKTYCNRLLACVKLGTLVGVTVSYEDEAHCETQETKTCQNVTTANPCPGGSSSSYSAAKHDQCVSDERAQDCSAFANRPTSCSTYCSTTSNP